MTAKKAQQVRCAVYTRVSTDQGLDQERMRGGPGRTRTCNQTVMSGRL